MNIDYLIKLLPNVKERLKESEANNIMKLGAKTGEIAKLERNGEYHGIAVEFLEDVPHLLTDVFVEKILRLLKKEEYIAVLDLLKLKTMDQVYYVLHHWFSFAVEDYDNSIQIYEKEYPQFDQWIETVRSDPLPGKIKIVDIGHNTVTGDSVVPQEWLGKEFKNGEELHIAMDKLVSRLGKPPVTYAIIYSMIKQTQDTAVTDLTGVKYTRIFYLELKDGKLERTMTISPRKGFTYVIYGKNVIGFIMKDILENNPNTKSCSVGQLISRLQKSIRRGSQR